MRLMFDVVDNDIKEMHCEGPGEELFANLGSVVSLVLTQMGGDKDTASVLWDFFVKMMQENKDEIISNVEYHGQLTS